MKLFLLRHAKTNKDVPSGKDFDREINAKGFEQLTLMNSFLKEQLEDKTFRVFCSTAKRTRTTYNKVKNSLNISHVSFHEELYLASLNEWLNFLSKQSSETPENVLFIGHNEGISEVYNYLTGEEIMLPTCGLVEIDFPDFEKLNELSKETGLKVRKYFPETDK